MIIFNTLSQAKNYIKRHKSYNYDEGCGCCFNHSWYQIDKNLVLRKEHSSVHGNVSMDARVIGRIKARL